MQLYFLIIVISSWKSEATLRILGGRNALKDEFPFAVRLEIHQIRGSGNKTQLNIFQFCSGAAVTTTWVLSAAHCHEPFDAQRKQFVRYNSYFPKYSGHISPILEYRVLPGYREELLINYENILVDNLHNDVGLIRCEIISVSMYAKISSVNYRALVGHEVMVLGFGATNASDTEKPLQVLKGMLNKCLEYDLAPQMMCLVPQCDLIATVCGGDSGGPILHSTGVVGVNSMSTDNCDEDTKFLKRTPGTSASIIAMVSPNLNWIFNTISNKTNNT